jgi:hypothetical protein
MTICSLNSRLKLPDFYKFEQLIALKRGMGIPADVYGSFSLDIEPGRLTVAELDKLTSGEGIDLSFDKLTILSDRTLAYKDSRVLLYIRDVHVHGDREREPRYHVCNCTTHKEMNERGRFDRYVVAAEVNGNFRLNIITNGNTRSERRHLAVCQNCLSELAFDGFNPQMPRRIRQQIVKNFMPDRFFVAYPRSLHTKKPTYDSGTAPLNNYAEDLPDISARVRQEAGWKCEKCLRILDKLRKYLDVHHIDGNRADNRRSNLKVLCISCHAHERGHSHLRNDPRFLEYLTLRATAPGSVLLP